MTGMQLTEDQNVHETGTIRNRQLHELSGGRIQARATLVMEDGNRHLPVVWWNHGSAPPDGSRVRIKGQIKTFRGEPELRANDTWVDRTGGGKDSFPSSVAAFYRACVEAEAASELRLEPGDSNYIVLDDTASPMHDTLSFDEASPHHAWFEAHRKATGENLLAGWPLVVGIIPGKSRHKLVKSPLLIARAELEVSDSTWTLRTPGTDIDFNPSALELLGHNKATLDEVAAEIDALVEVEESGNPARRVRAILDALEDRGIKGLKDLDPATLSSVPNRKGIHNAGVVMTASATNNIIRNLVGDLEEIANYPELLSNGPAAVFLDLASAPDVPPPEPHPTIAPTSLHQDKTVHAAMVNNFTVVTGPPGTGKSQVLVNVVAAAVAQGDTVLFASKNNRAVDVVVNRLGELSPGSIVIRAGTAAMRSILADSIARSLSPGPRSVDSVGARDAWKSVERSLVLLYRPLRERYTLEAELNACESVLKAILDQLPPGIRTEVDFRQLDAALADACRALDAFGDRLWWFGRRRRHRRRLTHARQALQRVGDILGMHRADIEACLNDVVERPVRTQAPRHAFRKDEQVARSLLKSADHRRRIHEIRARLRALPKDHEYDDRLHELHDVRDKASKQLLDARWNEVRHDDPQDHEAARELADCIKRISTGSREADREAFLVLPKALPALPVWAVSNMSARTNLPLQSGLFDLVVIDEASQCDIASALPLLVRGKRALIIGDRQQLVHITSLNPAIERTIARQSGLTDAQALQFSYTSKSCFALAEPRVSEAVFLDLHFRSHPAIIGFSNKLFYGGQLNLCSAAAPPEGLRAVQWVRVLGECTREPHGQSRMNEVEAQGIVQTVVADLANYGNRYSVGIVTPFVAQARRIRELLEERLRSDEREVPVTATAHRFQGDERDVMYFSPVIDRKMFAYQVRFAANRNLVNVAVTRARLRLVIVGDPDACRAHDNTLCALADYVLRLQESGFQSPLELDLSNALREKGIVARPDVAISGHRLGLAVEHNGIRLDIECDGAPFAADEDGNAARDQDVEAAGWCVMRFSGRELGPDNFDTRVKAILDRIG